MSEQPNTPAPKDSEPPDPAAAALEEAVGLAFRVLKAIMVLLVALFAGSGFFTVGSHEVAFVSRLGVLRSEALQPGLHWGWPVVERVVRVDKRPQAALVSSFDLFRKKSDLDQDRPPERQGGIDPRIDGYLLTGDASALHVSLRVRTSPHAPYQRAHTRVRDRARLVQVLLERATVRAAAYRGVDSLLGAGKTSFLDATKEELQASLQQTESGLGVQGLELARDLRPPPQTRAAFDRVTQTTQQVDGVRSSARTQAGQIVNQALVSAAKIKGEARSKAQRIVAGAKADVKLFQALRPSLKDDPSGVKRRSLEQRLLATALAEVLGQRGEVFKLGKGPLRIRLERDVSKVRRELMERRR